jgi:predicted RNA-binding Zn ribbon-like protein
LPKKSTITDVETHVRAALSETEEAQALAAGDYPAEQLATVARQLRAIRDTYFRLRRQADDEANTARLSYRRACAKG